MEQRHTAGPWEVKLNSDTGYYNIETETYVIAEVYMKKNTSIISAAPEMLEALELAEATIKRLNRHNSADGTLDVIRAAIQKAKGCDA
jgi:hypothetical protein